MRFPSYRDGTAALRFDRAEPGRSEAVSAPAVPGLTTPQKALAINLDPRIYGTLAEIGAGQEVARWLFRVGGAAGTVAKAVSAYDMAVSDAFYGPAPRYVSKPRLVQMLDHEYGQVLAILGPTRGDTTEFFAFADTVTALNYAGTNECHGWMGIRFQTAPHGRANQALLHVRMLDREAVAQHESLGVLGINLLYAAFFTYPNAEARTASLLDNLSSDRIEVDVLDLSGPEFDHEDHRLAALFLVKLNLSDAALFGPDGRVLQPSEVLRKKPILVERGSFRPVTNTNVDILDAARRRFAADLHCPEGDIASIMELTLQNLVGGCVDGKVDLQDFLGRVETLAAAGSTAMVSDYFEYHRLAAFLGRLTDRPVALALGVSSLAEIFDEKYYRNLDGGMLEAVGRLFKTDLRIYVYPLCAPGDPEPITAESWHPPDHLKHLYRHLLAGNRIIPLDGYKPECLRVYSREVLGMIRRNEPGWQGMVPEAVAAIIERRGLFRTPLSRDGVAEP